MEDVLFGMRRRGKSRWWKRQLELEVVDSRKDQPIIIPRERHSHHATARMSVRDLTELISDLWHHQTQTEVSVCYSVLAVFPTHDRDLTDLHYDTNRKYSTTKYSMISLTTCPYSHLICRCSCPRRTLIEPQVRGVLFSFGIGSFPGL